MTTSCPSISTSFADHLRESLTLLLPNNRARFIAWLTANEGVARDSAWDAYAHHHQKIPASANNGQP
jgi:hypothetical protein